MKSLLILILSTLLGGGLLHAAPEIPAEYPLKTCPVSKELLGSGGMVPFKVVHDNVEVWLCCKMCKKKFDQAPDDYTKPVRDALLKP